MNSFDKMPNKIAVDCRMLNKSGIGIYLKNLLYYWLQLPNIQWILIGRENELITLPLNENCHIIECNIPIFSLKELVNFPTEEINKCDLFYSPNFNVPGGINIPIYITIHDVVFLDFPELVNPLGLWIRRYMLKRAFKLAYKIFTVSEFSKQRIIYHLGNGKEIIVAYNGLRADLLNFTSENVSRIYDFDYFLFIGNIKKYKGLNILLEAMEGIDKKLVIVGTTQNLKTSDKIIIEKIRSNENIKFENYIKNDEILYSIIANAIALIQPSRYEGFGIPPLESLFLGTPAIVSDIPVFREIYGKLPVIFFKDGDSNDLRLKLKKQFFPHIDTQVVKDAYSYQTTAFQILDQTR